MTSSRWTLERRPHGLVWKRLVISAVALSATIMITMVVFEESLIFFPDRYPNGFWDAEAVGRASGTTVEDCFFDAADGVRLHAWSCRPRSGAGDAGATADMVLLWFHGNAGNLSQRADLMVELAAIPVQVFIIDYRGYGRSEGRPSERGLVRDARAAWRYLTEDRGFTADRIVVLGKSLGGAVAVDLAAEAHPAGLIVESSFASIPAMAAHYYPFVPRWLIRTRFDSLSKIGKVACPVMVIHSPDDEIVPFEQGRRLFDAAAADKRFFEVPGAAHNELWLVGGVDYLRALRQFLLACHTKAGGQG